MERLLGGIKRSRSVLVFLLKDTYVRRYRIEYIHKAWLRSDILFNKQGFNLNNVRKSYCGSGNSIKVQNLIQKSQPFCSGTIARYKFHRRII